MRHLINQEDVANHADLSRGNIWLWVNIPLVLADWRG